MAKNNHPKELLSMRELAAAATRKYRRPYYAEQLSTHTRVGRMGLTLKSTTRHGVKLSSLAWLAEYEDAVLVLDAARTVARHATAEARRAQWLAERAERLAEAVEAARRTAAAAQHAAAAAAQAARAAAKQADAVRGTRPSAVLVREAS